MFRDSYSEGFHAPHIGEFYSLGSRFHASITDRCSNVSPADAAHCAELGVPPGYMQLNPQISVNTTGNPNLIPETSDTYTAGLSWDVGTDAVNSVDGLLVELNYYDIEVDDAVQALRSRDPLDACIDNLSDFACDAINRTPNGSIISIDGQLQNSGGIETSGIDLNLDLRLAESNVGGFDRIAREGTEVGSRVRGYVETKSTLNTDWTLGPWFARLLFRYLSALTEQCTGLVADFEQTQLCSNGPDTNELGSRWYTDAQVSRTPEGLQGGAWTFTLAINNLFDEKPPICFSCDLNNLDGTLYPIAGQL